MTAVQEVRIDRELERGQVIRVGTINGTLPGGGLFPGVWQVVDVIEPGFYRIERINLNRHQRRAKGM